MLPLNGIPLLEHSIRFAKQNTNILDTILVSTEDTQLKLFSEGHGIKVLDRPIHLSSDTATTIDVLKDALQQLGDKICTIVLLQATNPLRPKNLLREAIELFEKAKADSLMTVSRNHQKFGKIVNNKFIPFNYTLGQRSQDMEPLYFENGLLYIMKSHLIKKGKLMGKNHIPMIVDHPYAFVDIDTEYDLHYAEYVLTKYKDR
jgi:CMP-N-acetylneuraminic acid synthetase